MLPDVSVIMCVYDEELYVQQTISSIKEQSFTNWEFIIVLDSANDHLKSKLLEWTSDDQRIKLFFNSENIGLTKSLNKAVKEAKGKYIARIDADDFAHKDRLLKQFSFLEKHSGIFVLGTFVYIIDKDGKVRGKLKRAVSHEKISSGLLVHNQFVHASVMVRKQLFELYGMYNENYSRSQDYELWLRVRDKIKFCNLHEYLTYYRRHSESITQKKNIEQRLSGLKMMYEYAVQHKTSLTAKEKFLIKLFFLKQVYKIAKLAFAG